MNQARRTRDARLPVPNGEDTSTTLGYGIVEGQPNQTNGG